MDASYNASKKAGTATNHLCQACMLRGVYTALGASLAFLRPVSQCSITMLRCVAIALALSSVAALQPPLASRAAQAKANPAAVDVYSRATATSAARDVALYGLFGPSEAEKRAEQARLDAEQEALNERFRKESESDFAFMSVFGVVTCVGGGGLLAGILQGLRETGFAERTRVIAAETLGADSMTTSLECGKVTTLPGITSVAKSLGAAAPSSTVFTMAYELYDRDEKSRLVMPLRVTDHEAVNACLRFADDHRVLVEPACGAALAAVYGGQKKAETWLKGLKDGPIVVEVCGGAIVDRGVLEAYAKQFGIEE